jgi:hypothetical protein
MVASVHQLPALQAMKKPLKKVAVVILGVLALLTSVSSFWRSSSARVTEKSGAVVSYRVYRSLAGQIYIEGADGPLIIYPSRRTVTYGGPPPVLHTRSWIVLDPIRAFVPMDKPVALDCDPRVEVERKKITLNVTCSRRVTIGF